MLILAEKQQPMQLYAGAAGVVASLSGQHGRCAFPLVLSLHERVIALWNADLVFILTRDSS
jgi:hypothetical protein